MSSFPLWEKKKNPFKKRKKERRKHKTQMTLGMLDFLFSQMLHCISEMQLEKATTAGPDSVIQTSGPTLIPGRRNTLSEFGVDISFNLPPVFNLLTWPFQDLEQNSLLASSQLRATGTAYILGEDSQ